MKKCVLMCLVLSLFLSVLVGCCFSKESSIDNTESNKETFDYVANGNIETEKNFKEILEQIAAMRPTLDEFKQMYPDCRTLRESIDGSYSYIDISTSQMPDILFSFERYFGKNGYSQIYLTSINVNASLVLPEYINMSIEDILENEGELAFYQEIRNDDITYGDVYIYREDFYYYIQGYVHPNKLGEDGVYIKLYNDSLFSPIENKFLDIETETNIDSVHQLLKNLSVNKCTLDQFKTIFNDCHIVNENESSITIVCDSLKEIEFEFRILTDDLNKAKTVLSYIKARANIIMTDYVGLERYELVKAGMEMPRNNDFDYHYLFLYEEEYCICINLYTDVLENDTAVYIIPYTDSWIRPW